MTTLTMAAKETGITDKLFSSRKSLQKVVKHFSISSPEPTCLLASTKTRSSGIIDHLVPRALVSFAFKI